MANDSSTTLNTGTGGDVIDESSLTQADGSTAVKRARVDLGFDADDARGRLVAKGSPLPVVQDAQTELLKQIAEDVRELKDALIMWMEG